MRGNLGKRLFIAALALCLLLVCALCWSDARSADVGMSAQVLENGTLSIEVSGDGAVYIGGEGELSSADMKLLLDSRQIMTHQVNDIVLGDGITEVGYNAINGYMYLQTLKLGAGMRVVDNGAIKSCTALEYVYIPATIQRLGRDFLYRSDRVLVVTDGERNDLPKLKNVPSTRVLTRVDSYEALLERRAALVPAEGEADYPEVPEACGAWWGLDS